MGLKDRLERLESGKGKVCRTCGFTGDWSRVPVVVEWCRTEERPTENVYCEGCGRPIETVLMFDDTWRHRAFA